MSQQLGSSHSSDDLHRAIDVIIDLPSDLSALSVDQLRTCVQSVKRASSVLQGCANRLHSELAQRACSDRSVNLHHILRSDGGMTGKQASQHSEIASRAPKLKHSQTELSRGGLTANHFVQLARAQREAADAFTQAEADLVDTAQKMSPDRFARHVSRWIADQQTDDGESRFDRLHRKRFLRIEETASGMYRIRGDLDPEAGSKVQTVLTAASNDLWQTESRKHRPAASPPQRMADAFTQVVVHNGEALLQGVGQPGRPVLHVALDYDLLSERLSCDPSCDTSLHIDADRATRASSTTSPSATDSRTDDMPGGAKASGKSGQYSAGSTRPSDRLDPLSKPDPDSEARRPRRLGRSSGSGRADPLKPSSPTARLADAAEPDRATPPGQTDRQQQHPESEGLCPPAGDQRSQSAERDRSDLPLLPDGPDASETAVPDRTAVEAAVPDATVVEAVPDHRRGGFTQVGMTTTGTALSPATIRRLACDADIIPTVMGAKGVILDQGRRHRTATPAQRSALILRDQHCVFPGCDRPPSWCQIHHLIPWEAGGPSNLDNLAMICSAHHHLIHEGGWTLERPEPGTWTAHPPQTETSGPEEAGETRAA